MMQRLSATRVILVGVGGVGSWCAEALIRSGIGHLTIVDSDAVDVTNINRQLEQVGYKNLGVNARPNLVVLNSSRAPAVLVEVGFINSDIDNYLFDTRFDETARAIADGIAGTLWSW